jgi:hypothetical protein
MFQFKFEYFGFSAKKNSLLSDQTKNELLKVLNLKKKTFRMLFLSFSVSGIDTANVQGKTACDMHRGCTSLGHFG